MSDFKRKVSTLICASFLLSASFVTFGASQANAAEYNATGDENWLGWLNIVRQDAGLPPVTANAQWSKDAAAHAKYAVRNQQFAHDEIDSLPFSTPAGKNAAKTGNLYGATERFKPSDTIAGWMESPGHAMWMLHPGVKSAGYGEFSDPNQAQGAFKFPLRWVAVLPLVDSVDSRVSVSKDFIFLDT